MVQRYIGTSHISGRDILELQGADRIRVVHHSSMNFQESFTFAMLLQPIDTIGLFSYAIIGKGNPPYTATNGHFFIEVVLGKLRIYLHSNNGINSLVAESHFPIMNTNEIIHIAVTWDFPNKLLTLYKNGVEENLNIITGGNNYSSYNSMTLMQNNSNDIIIGEASGKNNAKFKMYHLLLSPRAWSSINISNLYNAIKYTGTYPTLAKIVFSSNRAFSGKHSLCTMNEDGTNQNVLYDFNRPMMYPKYSLNGNYITSVVWDNTLANLTNINNFPLENDSNGVWRSNSYNSASSVLTSSVGSVFHGLPSNGGTLFGLGGVIPQKMTLGHKLFDTVTNARWYICSSAYASVSRFSFNLIDRSYSFLNDAYLYDNYAGGIPASALWFDINNVQTRLYGIFRPHFNLGTYFPRLGIFDISDSPVNPFFSIIETIDSTVSPYRAYSNIKLSRNNNFLGYSLMDNNGYYQVYIRTISGDTIGSEQQVTGGNQHSYFTCFSWSNDKVFFNRQVGGLWQIMRSDLDGQNITNITNSSFNDLYGDTYLFV